MHGMHGWDGARHELTLVRARDQPYFAHRQTPDPNHNPFESSYWWTVRKSKRRQSDVNSIICLDWVLDSWVVTVVIHFIRHSLAFCGRTVAGEEDRREGLSFDRVQPTNWLLALNLNFKIPNNDHLFASIIHNLYNFVHLDPNYNLDNGKEWKGKGVQ